MDQKESKRIKKDRILDPFFRRVKGSDRRSNKKGSYKYLPLNKSKKFSSYVLFDMPILTITRYIVSNNMYLFQYLYFFQTLINQRMSLRYFVSFDKHFVAAAK